MPKAFISYRRADSSSLATLLAIQLKAHGIDAFVDTRSIDGGGPFPDRLRRAIAESDVFICLLGATTLDSDWVREEIRHAHSLGKILIPVFQERYVVPDPVSDDHVYALLQSDGVHILDVRNLYVDDAIETLARMVRGSVKRTKKRAGGLLRAAVIMGVIAALALAGLFLAQNRNRAEQGSTPTDVATMPVSPQDAIGRARNFSGGNDEWTPIEADFDGVPMVLVPAGCFLMGSENDGEQPTYEQCFTEPYWIDKYEVTNAQFAQFGGVAAAGSRRSGENHPREQLTWIEAEAFCERREARLPTEREWEYAARGPDNRVYPWGDAFIGDNAVYNPTSGGQTAEVGSRPGGASWVGAQDMSGNIWEWVSSLYEPYPYDASDGREADPGDTSVLDRVLRGGWWGGSEDEVRAAFRGRYGLGGWSDTIGFRCARAAEELPELNPTETQPAATLAPDSTSPEPLQAAIERARTFSGNNDDWTLFEEEFDGVPMVLVPAGCFMMGSTPEQVDDIVNQLDVERERLDSEQPAHEQCFDAPFWIDKYEVTNAQFAQLGGIAVDPSNWTDDNQPRDFITWFEALDFCEQRGARLPTEREWEYAARGPDSRIFPWGDEAIAENVVYAGNSGNQSADVGSRPGGMSWVGALDMSGNVYEWVSSLYRNYPYDADDGREVADGTASRVLRGGGWVLFEFHAAHRSAADSDFVSSGIGFRCARSISIQTSQPAIPLTDGQTLLSDELQAAIERARNFSGTNDDWTPFEAAFDGVPMMLVPAGCFMMGSNDGDADEQPIHEQCFDAPFWIDKYEVTNAQFAQFGGVAARASIWTGGNRPREQLTWFEAHDFCEARGLRLTTEREWEYAARGPNALVFPWGDEFVSENVIYSSNSGSQTADVGSRPGGASWVGAMDMSGNVWEWVSSLYQPYPYVDGDGREAHTGDRTEVLRVARGGSWGSGDFNVRASLRIGNIPSGWDHVFGFRCARSL